MNCQNKMTKTSSLSLSLSYKNALRASLVVFIAATFIVGGFFVAANHTNAAGAIEVTATTNTKVYDGTTSSSAIPTLTSGTLDPGDTAIYSETYDTKDVGTSKTLTPNVVIKNASDVDVTAGYTITYVNDTTGEITKATPTLSVTNSPAIYDGATHAATVTGSVAGVESSVLTGGSATQTNAGTYAVTADFAPTDSTNYNSLTGASAGDFVVNKVILIITGTTATTKIYNGNTSASVTSGTLSGFVGSETVIVASSIGTFDTPNVGTEKTVAVSYILADGTNGGLASNYSLANTTTTADITAKAITVTADDQTKVYGAANPDLTATVSGFVNNETLETSGVIGSAAVSTTATASTGVGTPAITVAAGTLTATNYDFTVFTSGTLTITQAPLTITPANNTKVYGQANPTLVGEITGIQNSDNITATYAAAADETTVVGTAVITAIPVDPDSKLGNYNLTNNSGTMTITAKSLTVLANSASKTYGGTVTFTGTEFTTDGLVNSDAVNSVTLTSEGAVGTASVSGSPYAIVASNATGAGLGNYTISYTDGALAIAKANAVITVTPYSATYDGNPYTATGSALDVNGGALTGLDLSGTTHTSAGTYNGDAWIFTDTTGNYNDASGTVDDSISQVALTITAEDKTKVYGEANPDLTASYSGFILGENESVLDTPVSLSTTADNTSPVSAYEITASGATDVNYNISFVSGTLTVTPAPITVTADVQTKVYDGNTSAIFTLGVTGVVGSDDVTAIGGTADFADANVNTGINVTASGYTLAGAQSGNYSINNPTAQTTADITKKSITATINVNNKTYDGDTSAVFSSTDPRVLIGVVTGDDVTAIGGVKAFLDQHAGIDKPVTATDMTLSGNDAGNYEFDGTGTGTATINPRQITITAVTDSKIYDSTTVSSVAPVITNTSGSGIVTDPIVLGDSANFVQTYDNENTGTSKTLTPSGTVSDGNGGNNYVITFADTTGVITPLEITVTPNANLPKVYGDADPIFTYTSDSLIGTDSFTGTLSRDAGEDVGTYALILGTLSAGGNYTLTLVPGTFSINQTTPVITWVNPADIVYGTALSATQLNATADVSGAFVYTPALGTVLNVGGGQTLEVTFTPTDTVNYFNIVSSVSITVTPALITVTADNQSKNYGNVDPALTYTNDSLVGSDVFTGSLSRAAGENIGEYSISQGTLALSDNYTLTFVGGTLTINLGSFSGVIALTSAGQWALVSAPTLLSQAPTFTDDASGAVALLVYRNGAFVVPSAGDDELVNPLSAFYVKTTSTGKVGIKFATLSSPTQVSKELSVGWNLVGTNNNGLAENEFSSIQNTPTNAGMVTLFVPDTFNSRKDTGYASWNENANQDLNANPITALPDNNLSAYDGYWVFMNVVKAFVKNL